MSYIIAGLLVFVAALKYPDPKAWFVLAAAAVLMLSEIAIELRKMRQDGKR